MRIKPLERVSENGGEEGRCVHVRKNANRGQDGRKGQDTKGDRLCDHDCM